MGIGERGEVNFCSISEHSREELPSGKSMGVFFKFFSFFAGVVKFIQFEGSLFV